MEHLYRTLRRLRVARCNCLEQHHLLNESHEGLIGPGERGEVPRDRRRQLEYVSARRRHPAQPARPTSSVAGLRWSCVVRLIRESQQFPAVAKRALLLIGQLPILPFLALLGCVLLGLSAYHKLGEAQEMVQSVVHSHSYPPHQV